jgi:membrane fusion protein (multidrug efflux system)
MSASDVVRTEFEAEEKSEIRSVRWRAWGVGAALVIAGVALAVVGSRYLAAHVTTDDAFVVIPTVYVSSQVPGRVVEILVEEHQRVGAGDVLARLDPAEYELNLARAKASLAMVRNRVVQAEAATASADADRKAATVEEWRTERELERVRALRKEGTASPRELDTAQATYDAAQARVRALELRVEAEHALVNDDSQVQLAEAESESAALQLERTLIRAPFAGVVGRRNVELGTVVVPGQPLLALVSTGEASVMANFKETQLEHIRIGARADVTIDAFPGVVWRGRVDSFSPATGAEYALIAPEPAAGNFTKVVQRVPVKIVLPPAPAEGELREDGPLLTAGLSAEVDVRVD